MRARYYNPEIGRFINEDTHWNPSNIIYGDRTFEEDETKYHDYTVVLQSGNLYGYCMGSPIKYNDCDGYKVFILGKSAAANMGISIECDEFLLFDDKFNIGIYNAIGGGAGFFGASIDINVGYIDVDTIYDMSEISLTLSVSGGELVSGGYSLSLNSSGKRIGRMISIGVGVGSPIDYSAQPFTFSRIKGINIVGGIKKIQKIISNWL